MAEQLGFEFKPAVRTGTPMIIGISGASGSGKTYTALELAMGLAGKGKVAFVDTEGRRALHYADLGPFKFDHLDFQAPYTPARFLAALKQAAAAGYAVIIVDSFSDEYVGEGGLVDMANAEQVRVKNTAAAWAMPKAQHKLVTRWLRQSRCHVIFCLRAEEKVRLEKVERGGREQTVVVPIGWQAICEKNVPYEMATSFMLTPDAPGIPHPIKLQEQHKAFFPLDRPVTRATGEKLAAWCAGGAPPPPDVGTVDGVPQRRSSGGFYTQTEVDQIADLPDPRGGYDAVNDPPFDPDDPFGFGFPDDTEHRVVADGLPMSERLNGPDALNALHETHDRAMETLFQETELPSFETAKKPEKVAEKPEKPAEKPEKAVQHQSNTSNTALPDSMSWPAFAAAITANLSTYDEQDIKALRKSLEVHPFKKEAPMIYARVLGELVDRERALAKR